MTFVIVKIFDMVNVIIFDSWLCNMYRLEKMW